MKDWWKDNNLLYIDDIVLLATSSRELQDILFRVKSAENESSRTINETKTKAMIYTVEVLEISVESRRLKQGIHLRAVQRARPEVKSRLATDTAMARLWKNRTVNTNSKAWSG